MPNFIFLVLNLFTFDTLESFYVFSQIATILFLGEIRTEGSAEWNTSDLTARLAWINWESLGVGPARRSILSNFQFSSDTMATGCQHNMQPQPHQQPPMPHHVHHPQMHHQQQQHHQHHMSHPAML